MELLVKRAMGGDGESFIQLMEKYREFIICLEKQGMA